MNIEGSQPNKAHSHAEGIVPHVIGANMVEMQKQTQEQVTSATVLPLTLPNNKELSSMEEGLVYMSAQLTALLEKLEKRPIMVFV